MCGEPVRIHNTPYAVGHGAGEQDQGDRDDGKAPPVVPRPGGQAADQGVEGDCGVE